MLSGLILMSFVASPLALLTTWHLHSTTTPSSCQVGCKITTTLMIFHVLISISCYGQTTFACMSAACAARMPTPQAHNQAVMALPIVTQSGMPSAAFKPSVCQLLRWPCRCPGIELLPIETGQARLLRLLSRDLTAAHLFLLYFVQVSLP